MTNTRWATHTGNIVLSTKGISELYYSKPKRFENSQVNPPPILSLIRDTERHERVLYTMTPSSSGSGPGKTSIIPRSNTAVGVVLGGYMMDQLRGATRQALGKGDVDVETLLEGAEKLAAVYPVPNAIEAIKNFRERFSSLTTSIDLYEQLVAAQKFQLDKQRENENMIDEDDANTHLQPDPAILVTMEMLLMEEAEIRLLEARKEELERVSKYMDNI